MIITSQKNKFATEIHASTRNPGALLKPDFGPVAVFVSVLLSFTSLSKVNYLAIIASPAPHLISVSSSQVMCMP